MARGQRQRSGSGSQQIQVAGDLVVSFSEERAAEIARAQAEIVVQEFVAEGAIEARRRVDSFDSKLIDELGSRELLGAFADPAFQVLLRRTQMHAAATSDDDDHEVLSKLLAERAESPSKPMHMIVARSVEVIEYIDQPALKGLTAAWFVVGVKAIQPKPSATFEELNSIAGKLYGDSLPTGAGWLQRLDLLGCVRYQLPGLQRMKKWEQIISETYPGYVCQGVAADEVDLIRERLKVIAPGLPSWLVPHVFLPEHFRINTPGPRDLAIIFEKQMTELGKTEELSSILTDAKVDIPSTDAGNNLSGYVRLNWPTLERLRNWWDSIEGGFSITPLGVAVAYSNAKRFVQFDGLGRLPDMIGANEA